MRFWLVFFNRKDTVIYIYIYIHMPEYYKCANFIRLNTHKQIWGWNLKRLDGLESRLGIQYIYIYINYIDLYLHTTTIRISSSFHAVFNGGFAPLRSRTCRQRLLRMSQQTINWSWNIRSKGRSTRRKLKSLKLGLQGEKWYVIFCLYDMHLIKYCVCEWLGSDWGGMLWVFINFQMHSILICL